MSLTSGFFSALRFFNMLVLSITPHARLTLASEPRDYDDILKHTIRETKFYSETLLAILFVIENEVLISQTIACLLFSLIIYIALEAMTGEALHKSIDEIPCGRVVLACMTKLPALSVLWTICAMALSQWDSLATKIVLCIVAGVLVLGLALRLRVHVLVRDICATGVRYVKSGVSAVVGLFRKTAGDDESAMSNDSMEKDSNPPLTGDECV